MKSGISIRKFAEREGVSDTAVRKAIKHGKLKAYADGTLDPSLVGTAWRKANIAGANQRCKPANQVRTKEVRTGSQVRSDGAGQAQDLSHLMEEGETIERAAERLVQSGQVPSHDYAEALRRKENYLALLRQLEYEQKSGTLVDLELAERVLFEGARAQRDAWLSWPSKVGPLLAADFSLPADKMTAALTEYVHKQIAQLGEPDVQFDGK